MTKIRTILSTILILVGLSSCKLLTPVIPQAQVERIYTQAALTYAAEHPTQPPILPGASLTPMPPIQTTAGVIPTFTPLPSATPLPSDTPLPTATPLPTTTPLATATSYYYGCYYNSYLTYESIPDGTTFYPGQTFYKTWEFYNSGSCAWREYFRLVFIYGKRMDGLAVYVDDYIWPGE
ncbi:MAG: hypothetical protein C0391_07665, partial [Anaerolinea sp.]|nr:hypothetical protein [Anaerolinea sp.]